MDPFSRKMLEELEQMRQDTGRILRSMSLSRMMPTETEGWNPPVDIYESEKHLYVYAAMSGVLAESLRVTVADQRLFISGTRQLPAHPAIASIHQLEIELGNFQRTLILPSPVEIEGVESSYVNGILLVTLPKQISKGQVSIRIRHGA
jgi:HSP20 family protein